MAYGITCTNTSGQLTLDSDGYLLGYLGKATFSSVVHASGDSNTNQAGYAIYTFTAPTTGVIMCALGLRSAGTGGGGGGQRIISVTRTGSNTWQINVVDTSLTTEGVDNMYFVNRSDASIYVWGVPSSVSGYGMALYSAAGTLTADLSRRPMQFTERVSFGTDVMTKSINSYVKPAIIGHTNSSHRTTTNTGGGSTPWFNQAYSGVWTWDSGGTSLMRGDMLDGTFRDDAPGSVDSNHGPTSIVLIEANGLT